MEAYITEIFQSLQGEGPYQGTPQLFIRFFGCDLSCAFCDTKPFTYKQWQPDELMSHINQFGGYHSVSLTGGEPLKQAGFLQEFLPRLKREQKTVYLETNGIFYQEAAKIIRYVDIVAMDFKLASSTGLRDFWSEHREFLRMAADKELFIKAVITPATCEQDICAGLALIKEMRPQALLVLQPACPFESQLAQKIQQFAELAKQHSVTVRIMRQLHKQLGIK